MATSKRADLLAKANATGSFVSHSGGACWLVAYGTWNSATASLDYDAAGDGSVAIQCKDILGNAATLTANGIIQLDLPAGKYRISFSGSPTSISAYLTPAIKVMN